MTDRRIHFASTRARRNIACPACGFSPFRGMQWICSPDGCGGSFDTFATQGRCPHCDAQFSWTQCPVCQHSSSHRSWYRSGI